MKKQEIIKKYAQDRYQFEKDCKKCLAEALKKVDNKYDVFETFCENIDGKFMNQGETAAYIRICWETDCENPADLADEMLDIAKRYNVIQYCVFYDDNDIVIVAVYEQK